MSALHMKMPKPLCDNRVKVSRCSKSSSWVIVNWCTILFIGFNRCVTVGCLLPLLMKLLNTMQIKTTVNVNMMV